MTERPPRPSILRAALARALGTGLLLVMVPAGVVGGYWFYGQRQEREIAELEAKLEEQRLAFEAEIGNLLGEERRAQFRVLAQEERDGVRWNTIRFIEFFRASTPGSDAAGEEIAFERTFELPGREVYIDALSVKFDASVVRSGAARNFSVFRRAFSNTVRPDDGVLLYEGTLTEAGRLAAESVELDRPAIGQRYLRLLRRYLTDPEAARADSVRIVEGQANYTNPRPGYYYELVQQASGGLTIVEREIPAILAESGSAKAASTPTPSTAKKTEQ